MIDRRTLIAGSVALGASRAAWGATPDAAKHAAIDAVAVPPGFSGALAYGRRGRIVHVRYLGAADIEAGRAVTPTTRFRWGSATKWLVSVAALRLAEQGRLSLDAPIVRYLPDFRRDTGERVLVRHLLSNTSGIPDLLTRRIPVEPELRTSPASSAAIVARFGGGDLEFVPGQGWDYAALNWAIVAAVLERVSGMPLPTLVERTVLRPLGLSQTGFAQSDRPAMPDLAAAYAGAAPAPRKMAPVPPFLAASGTVAGTVGDAVRAAHGIFHGNLLAPASLRMLTTVHWPAQEYALGGRVHAIDGQPWAWETGKVGGYRAHVAHRLTDSETIVVCNTTDMDQGVIGGWVEAIARA